MSKILTYLTALVLLAAGSRAMAQTNSPSFIFTIAPPTNTVMILETTNMLSVLFSNMAVTNKEEVVGEDGTTTTNDVIALQFSNVLVTASFPVGTNQTLRDDGVAPDKTMGDFTYSANWIVPTNLTGTNVLIRYTIRGLSLTVSNETGELTPQLVTTNVTVSYPIAARPGNDRFTNAFKIPSDGGVILGGSNNYALMETGEPKHAKVATADQSVWWIWSSPITTNVLIDTAGSDFKTVLGVYTVTNVPSGKNATVTNLVEVASAGEDLVNKLRAHVNFNAQAGVSYRIAVAGQDTNSVGKIRLHVVPGGIPDTHPPLTTISYPDKDTLTTVESIYVYGVAKEPVITDSGISRVVIQVGSGPLTNLVTGTDNWSSMVIVPPGTNVVRVYSVDYAGNVGLADSIVVRYINPTNDHFIDAIALTGVGDIVTAINGRATIEAGEPLKAGNIGGHSIWYSWRAPNTGELTLSTSGSGFDTLLGMYVGTNVTNLVTINGNDDAYENSGYSELTQGVLSNQVYHIAIDGYGGASGNVVLQYAFTAPTPGQYYKLTTATTPGGDVSPQSGLYPAGSRVVLTATPQKQFVFSRWEGSVSSPQNPLTVTMTSDMSLTARFQFNVTTGTTNSTTEDFESGGLAQMPWTTSATNGWIVQTNTVRGGKYAARAGAVADSQQSTLVLVTNTTVGVGSFDLMASSEDSWDYLEFSLNGKVLKKWSGESGWTNYLFDVPAGTNTFQWRYAKDNSFNGGRDTAFIDNLYIPLALPSGGAGSAKLYLVYTPEGMGQITVQGQANRNYLLEASTDLVSWLPIDSKASNGTGVAQFLDAEANIYPQRFYRTSAQ